MTIIDIIPIILILNNLSILFEDLNTSSIQISHPLNLRHVLIKQFKPYQYQMYIF